MHCPPRIAGYHDVRAVVVGTEIACCFPTPGRNENAHGTPVAGDAVKAKLASAVGQRIAADERHLDPRIGHRHAVRRSNDTGDRADGRGLDDEWMENGTYLDLV